MGHGSGCFFILQSRTTGQDIPGATICSVACDPRKPNMVCNVAAGDTCVYDDSLFANPYGTCLPAGTLGANTVCMNYNQCVAGLSCVPDGNQFKCHQVCDQANPCTAGTCTPFVGNPTAGLGFCPMN